MLYVALHCIAGNEFTLFFTNKIPPCELRFNVARAQVMMMTTIITKEPEKKTFQFSS